MSFADDAFLQRSVDLAREALDTRNSPFASVLVGSDGTTLMEALNREGEGDPTSHPEFVLARWAALNLDPSQRAGATVYTSGEHCAMCSAAHAWCGLGSIRYAASIPELWSWWDELELGEAPVSPLRIHEVAPHIDAVGPSPQHSAQVRELIYLQFGK